jgi:hypothetical protein
VRVADTKPGDVLEADGGFTCMKKGTRRIVQRAADGLYIICSHGRHGLAGQLSDDSTHYVGLYPVSRSQPSTEAPSHGGA